MTVPDTTLTWQALAQLLSHAKGILLATVGHMQINHGRVDLFMAEHSLDGMEAGPHLQQMSGKGMT